MRDLRVCMSVQTLGPTGAARQVCLGVRMSSKYLFGNSREFPDARDAIVQRGVRAVEFRE